ncbi:hypothetical protein PHYSODRAFT_305391 [Phytophthora sojae]|uniref:Uncharacterized protein n=1 Tax=Phytophthora sojae (strain P6497) TaxID=1094619 RepID=G5A380_PHYSP|nr:hypothetical protein PHYSODRAFT_305391 [Phytophthora sojae]EGZ10120.1 hypothetical protein PHYSODRAFT_305391 [Phytophthora sojae]|eukprot:XP_009534981.1 hypothetical protein PHYSODRAFT_305391 [Phytophthora sojae]
MSRILTASNTEQELLAVAKGLGSSSFTARDAREYHLRRDAIVRVTEEIDRRVVSWNSADIFQHGEVGGVVLVKSEDDVPTEWVDMLISGIGLCQVQRSSLVVCDHARISEMNPIWN